MNLLPPDSHTHRLLKKLEKALLNKELPERGEYTYIGCCIQMDAGELREMIESDEWVEEVKEDRSVRLAELREHCMGFKIWEHQRGDDEDLPLDNDGHVGFGRGLFAGHPCYWITHSGIEYVWAATPKCEHGNSGPCMDCQIDPHEMKVIPYAVLATELDTWVSAKRQVCPPLTKAPLSGTATPAANSLMLSLRA